MGENTACKTEKSIRHRYITFEPLFANIAGTSYVPSELPAMESDAAISFEEIFTHTHRNVNVIECALILSEEIPFIGGSPDRIIVWLLWKGMSGDQVSFFQYAI